MRLHGAVHVAAADDSKPQLLLDVGVGVWGGAHVRDEGGEARKHSNQSGEWGVEQQEVKRSQNKKKSQWTSAADSSPSLPLEQQQIMCMYIYVCVCACVCVG